MPFQNKFLSRRKYSESNCQFLPLVESRYVITFDQQKEEKILNSSQEKNLTLVCQESQQKSSQNKIEDENIINEQTLW